MMKNRRDEFCRLAYMSVIGIPGAEAGKAASGRMGTQRRIRIRRGIKEECDRREAIMPSKLLA
jgi:hypothetical protein